MLATATRTRIALALAFGFYFFPTPLKSQAPSRPPSPRFSLSQLRFAPLNLAARSAGMGGAFIGVANDATAAALNPAGAAFLTRPEISLNQAWGREERNFSYSQNPDAAESRMHFNSALVSFVYPFKGLTLAFYRQLAFRAGFEYEREQYLARDYAGPLALHEQLGASGNFPGMRSEFALEVWQDALVVAKTFSRRVRLGLAFRATQLRFNLHEQHYFAPELWPATQLKAGARGANQPNGLYRIYHIRHEEFRPSFNLGALVELSSALTLGLSYNYLPTYRLSQTLTLPQYVLPARPTTGAQNFEADEAHTTFEFDLPDNFGLGLSWKPEAKTLLALDAVWYRGRNLLRDIADKNLPQDDVPDAAGEYRDGDGRADWASKNIWAWHVGIEHLFFSTQIKMPLRFGFYHAAEFGIHALAQDETLQREYPPLQARGHFTGGLGLIVRSVRFEISLDLSENNQEGIGSVVMSF